MAIKPVLYRVQCDHCGALSAATDDTPRRTRRAAQSRGWERLWTDLWREGSYIDLCPVCQTLHETEHLIERAQGEAQP